jgi:hypothetical protein
MNGDEIRRIYPGRPEAIHRLIEAGLAKKAKR